MEWTKAANLNHRCIRFGNGVFVTVGTSNLYGDGGTLYTTTDGITFVQRATPRRLQGKVACHDGLWAALCEYGVITSTDAITWTHKDITNDAQDQLQHCQDLWVCSGNGKIWTSADGAVWTQRSNPTGTQSPSFFYYGGKYLSFHAGKIYTTTDFITWATVTDSTSVHCSEGFHTHEGGLVVFGGLEFLT
ncbi:MAG: hypothetical protein LBU98_00880 [Alistipes sp.]|jgi:hypothetical protein|nr:hypothetical protein [Alistipes sp.]